MYSNIFGIIKQNLLNCAWTRTKIDLNDSEIDLNESEYFLKARSVVDIRSQY